MSAPALDTRSASIVEPGTSRFDAYAVTTRTGPHVTMQAGVVHAGRFWTTTSRRSLKARSVAAHHVAAAVVSDGDRHRIIAGRTTAFRPLRPWTALADPTAPLRAGWAVARLGIEQIDELVGYVQAASSVPADWLPHRRALLVTRIDRSLTIDGTTVVAAEGDWQRDLDGPRPAPTDGTRAPAPLPLDQLPASHHDVVTEASSVHLGVTTPTGPVAVPAGWAGDDTFVVPTEVLSAVTASFPGPASAVFDVSGSRRPDRKRGAMFRGVASVVDVDDRYTLVSVRADRLTTWDGFDAGTVSVA